MRTLPITQRFVTGQTVRLVASVRLDAGTYDIDLILGVPGAVSTGTVLVRVVGGSTLATFASAVAPARQAAQRFTLATATEIEVVASNSTANVGTVAVDDIRVALAPLQLWANSISTRLGAAVGIDDTQITLADGAGATIGLSPTGGEFFLITIRRGTTYEIVRCTARTGDVLTVSRAQEGTSALAWAVTGTTVLLADTAATLTSIQGRL